MSGEAAITKVKSRLADWLDGEIGAGVTVGIDRPFDQALRDEDLPYVGVRVARVARQQGRPSHNATQHDIFVMFDIVAPSSATASIDEAQAEIEAAIVDRLGAMAPTSGTIGELIQLCEPVEIGPREEEFRLSDFGETVSAWRMVFLTPNGDFRSIFGTTGVVVP